MSSLTPRDVLDLWEETWGPLDEKWKNDFLNHKDMPEIIKFGYRQIDFCIRKTKKLSQLLATLKRTPLIRVNQQVNISATGKHISETGRLTIRSPGKSEEMLPGSEICPSCGVLVTPNNLKCRCD